MTSTVLVPLDGSEKDERALPTAAAIARLTDGALHLVRVVVPPDTTILPRAVMIGVPDVLQEERAKTERLVHDVASRVAADTGRRVTAEVVEGADVADTLLQRAVAERADLVVMATRAPGAIGRAVRGSVTDRLVRESAQPVVVVPPGADDTSGRQITLRRVLVPLDGSDLSLKAIDHLLSLPHAADLEYVLVEVVPPNITVVTPAPDAPAWATTMAIADANLAVTDTATFRANAEQRLNAVGDRLRARGASVVEVRVLEDVDPADAIARAVHSELADFIAMTTRGRSGFERLVLGSVAERVVRESDVPVLLVTATENDDASRGHA